VKPPRYPLSAVLEQRGAAKETKTRELAEAVQALEREKAVLADREQAKARLEQDRAARAARLYDPDPSGMLEMSLVQRRSDEIRHVDGRIAEAAQAILAQREAVARAEAGLEAARCALVEADRELKAVEKHHEAWLADWRKELGKKEQRQAEEVVLARYASEAGERGGE
jgi:flagellar biosynthesis chaperone FliJ